MHYCSDKHRSLIVIKSVSSILLHDYAAVLISCNRLIFNREQLPAINIETSVKISFPADDNVLVLFVICYLVTFGIQDNLLLGINHKTVLSVLFHLMKLAERHIGNLVIFIADHDISIQIIHAPFPVFPEPCDTVLIKELHLFQTVRKHFT